MQNQAKETYRLPLYSNKSTMGTELQTKTIRKPKEQTTQGASTEHETAMEEWEKAAQALEELE